MAMDRVILSLSLLEKQRIGLQTLSLTHPGDLVEPEIALGSLVEVGGALYEAAGNEAIAGLGAIANSSPVYVRIIAAGAVATAAGGIVAPTWSDAKQGWYLGNDRAVGGLYKDATGQYTKKWLYRQSSGGIQNIREYGDGTIEIVDDVTISGAVSAGGAVSADGGVCAGIGNAILLRKAVPIGNWNMDITESLYISPGVTVSKIINFSVIIFIDTAISCFSIDIGGRAYILPAGIYLYRSPGGWFDNVNFAATSFNRGWIMIEYTP